ncbi:MAG: hypothetical protein ACU0C9_08805 [Paracoccaceae bacterium]
MNLPEIGDFNSITVYGVSADVNGKTVLIGADRLMARESVKLGTFANEGDALGKRQFSAICRH